MEVGLLSPLVKREQILRGGSEELLQVQAQVATGAVAR